MTLHKFDEDYFENGIEKGISLYENYRWMPHVSLPLANYIKQKYKNKTILDYGCAKGFLVHALRILNVTAYGYDISEYALKNCKPEVRKFLTSNKSKLKTFQVVICKDVLEHFEHKNIIGELKWMLENSEAAMIIIPLGDNNKRYRIHEYGFDKTHLIKENEDWWINKFQKSGWKIEEFYYKIDCVKNNWYSHHPYGNATFFLKK